MILSFIRHGATEWNALGRMQGRRDIPLSAAGAADVAGWRLPASLPGNCRWLASPLARATQTARMLAGRAPSVEPALIEMDWGAWEGLTLDVLRERYGAAFARNEARGLDFRPDGGESPRDVVARLERWIATVPPAGEAAVAVTHNGVLRALLALATGWDMIGKPPVRLRPATMHVFELSAGPALAIVACNVALAGPAPIAPRPPAPSAALP